MAELVQNAAAAGNSSISSIGRISDEEDEDAYINSSPEDIALCEAAMAALRPPVAGDPREPDFAPADVRAALNALSTTIG